jgi:hypothetical protein
VEAPTDVRLPPQKKKKIQDNNVITEGHVQKALNLIQQPNDQEQIFGDYVASELRELKNPENRRKLKRLINHAIMQISDIDASEVNPTQPLSALPSLPSTYSSSSNTLSDYRSPPSTSTDTRFLSPIEDYSTQPSPEMYFDN